MTFNEYQELAARTINNKLSLEDKLHHAICGLFSEGGELSGIWQKFYQGHRDTAEHEIKEVGDILWMLAEYCTVRGFSIDEAARMNIRKLKARYPDGFTTERSINREEGDI